MDAYEDNEHGQLLKDLMPQLLVAIVKNHGGTYRLHVSQIDDTGQDLLSCRVDENQNFIFQTHKKM